MDLIWLVVEPTHLKNMLVKMGSSSPNRDKHKKSLKPPASNVIRHPCGISIIDMSDSPTINVSAKISGNNRRTLVPNIYCFQ